MLRQLRREKGQDLVEYALVLPVLLLLILGIADFAIVIFSYDTIGNAAREGARYGVIHPTDVAGIEARTRELTTGLDPASLSVSVTYPGGNTLQVEVTYRETLLTGPVIQALGGNPNIQLRANTTMRIE